MRYTAAFVLLFHLASTVLLGDDEPRRAQINAATADAFDSLHRQILAARLGRDVTVERFIDRYNAREQLNLVLASAQQIGGPRWLDDQMVQVRLEVSGDAIAKLIEGIAFKDPNNLPLPMRTLQERLKTGFAHRTFAAVGTSTTGSAASRLKPDDSVVAWRAVSEKDRRAAIEAARRGAMDHVIESLRAIEWDGNRHLADAMQVKEVHQCVSDWLAARPLRSIEFRDDLEVRISLAASPQDLWPTLQADLQKHGVIPPPHGPNEWEQLHQQVMTRMAPAVGRALAPATQPAAGAAIIVIPHDPPAWVLGPAVEVTEISPSVAGSKLRTARAAETLALNGIRARLNAMPFDPTMTLGEAAGKDPHIEQAITRSLRQARISKVEYDAPQPGDVRVKMQLDPQAVWREVAGR